MTIEDDLQAKFDSASTTIDLGAGSVEAVKQRAIGRTRNSRLMLSAAVIVAVAVVGSVLWRVLPDRNQPTEVVSAGEVPAASTTPLDGPVTEADFTYLGAFMLPAGTFGDSTFAYGGEAAAFNPGGDPESTDGFDGSLFMVGHPRQNVGIAEVSIPAPAPHDGDTQNLPVAQVLSPFTDITAGRGMDFVGGADVGGEDEYRYGGLEVVDGPDGPRLHWTLWQYNNASDNDVPGHGHSSLDLANPDPQGPWFLGDERNRVTPGYVFAVPQAFADASLGGQNLIAGYMSGATASGHSWGPPFFAYAPPITAPVSDRLDTTVLALYDSEENTLPGHNRADLAGGATWVTTSSGETAIVTVGRRALGEAHDGFPDEEDCNPYKGIHGGPYEPRVTFYDPADLARVAAGDLAPDEVRPYRTWNPAEHLVATCEWELSSISFDPEAGRVYVVQIEADTTQHVYDPVPVVHVFSL